MDDFDPIDDALHPRCPDCGVLMRDVPGGWQCPVCGQADYPPMGGPMPVAFVGPSIHGG